MEWQHSGPPQKIPKKILRHNSRLEFWDQNMALPNDNLPKGQTNNAEDYSSLLVQVRDILKEKRRGNFTKVITFLYDNAPAHLAHATLNKWPN